jgi:hypothetical protein
MHRISWTRLFAALACAPIATLAAADEITFDEILRADSNCCYLTTEYAAQGVTFETTDDGSIWGGLSNGNPGAWFLEGTNGPAFLGFNGASLSAGMLFDTPVTQFSLDMAPSIGWYEVDDLFILEGYREGALVDVVSGPPLGFGEWMTLELSGEIDEVQMSAVGPSFPNTYGIDNIQWLPVEDPVDPDEPGDGGEEPADLSVEIEVNPGNHHRHFLDLLRHIITRVAILGSDEFDVRTIDVDSLEAGPDRANAKRYTRVRDVNHDGMPDLMTVYRTRSLGLAFGDTELCVTGATEEGQVFEACDEIDTTPVRHRWWRRWFR